MLWYFSGGEFGSKSLDVKSVIMKTVKVVLESIIGWVNKSS